MLSIEDRVIDGLRTAVHDSRADGGDEAVVLVHGNPGPMDDFEPLIERVDAFARTVALDLPGYGRSERPRRFDFSVGGYARFLGQALDALGVRRAHLVLHDFGGLFGLQWAVDHPQAVASVTLINTGVLPGYRWHKFARLRQTPVVGEVFQSLTSRRMMELALNRDNPRPLPGEFVARIHGYADREHRRAVLKLYRATRDLRELDGLIPALRVLDLPACVVWGAEDAYVPVSLARRQLEAFPRAEIHVLPGLGHWPLVDDPDQVTAHVVPFLAEQLRDATGGQGSM